MSNAVATVPTATAPPAAAAAPLALPFQLSARKASIFSYSVGPVNLSATGATPLPPIPIPANGYLSHLNAEVTVTITGGSTPALTADSPFNVLQSVNLRTAAGNDIITPMTGYQLYLVNKYGCQYTQSPWSDARMGAQYSATTTGAHFFLPIPLELDASNALGALPNMAANRAFQLAVTLAAIPTLVSGSPSGVTVQINFTGYYWTQPPAASSAGVAQTQQPAGNGTLSQWGLSQYPLTPGNKIVPLNSSVGNVIRCLIFTLRNSSGARDGADWPALTEFLVDNDQLEYLTANEWQDNTQKMFRLPGNTKDTAGALDTGVYVLPFYAMAGGTPGDVTTPNSQVLPTLDATSVALNGQAWGAGASTLEVITNAVIPASASTFYRV